MYTVTSEYIDLLFATGYAVHMPTVAVSGIQFKVANVVLVIESLEKFQGSR